MGIMKYVIVLLLFVSNFVHGKEIYWYVAASMTKPAKEITENYNKMSKNKILLITGGSGELLSKIYASKRGDLYTPAEEFFLEKALQLGIIKRYKPILIQEPVFAISHKSKFSFDNITDLCKANIKIALGNPETMALGKGFKSIKALMPQELYNCIVGKKTIDPINISQTVSYLKNNVVDIGLLFKSVAKINKLNYIEIPSQWNVKFKAFLAELIYAQDSKATEEATKFILENLHIFEMNGFDVIK